MEMNKPNRFFNEEEAAKYLSMSKAYEAYRKVGNKAAANAIRKKQIAFWNECFPEE